MAIKPATTAVQKSDSKPRRGLPPAKERVPVVLRTLERLYPDAKCALNFADPLQLLVATILSAQCTDARVNLVTPALFERYKTAADYATADEKELESFVKSTNLYRNKAKNIRACCRLLIEKHGGKVPETLDELAALPGVGRKTANVVLGNCFGVPGITVDTHVGRLSRRLGLTVLEDPVKVEFALMKLVPQAKWTAFSHCLILHGRQVCHARSPQCPECVLAELCPKRGVSSSRVASSK